MTIINKCGRTKYSELASRDIAPGGRSADSDIGGFTSSLTKLVNSCGSWFCVKMNDKERDLVRRLLDLDSEGSSFRFHARKPAPVYNSVMADAAETRAKMASIAAERAREEAIKSETTYVKTKDADEARSAASKLRGDVKAKKLDMDVTGTVSLTDLMSDNKFIEERMSNTNIKTSMASEDGWDVDLMNKISTQNEDNPVTSEDNDALIDPSGDERSSKKNRGRRSRK